MKDATEISRGKSYLSEDYSSKRLLTTEISRSPSGPSEKHTRGKNIYIKVFWS